MRYEYAIKLLKKLNANGIKYKLIKVCSTCYDVVLVEDEKPKKKNKKSKENVEKETLFDNAIDDNDNSNLTSPTFPEELK